MSLVGLLIVLVVVGAALYLLQLVPIDATVKTVIRVVVIAVLVMYCVVFLASLLGLPSPGCCF